MSLNSDIFKHFEHAFICSASHIERLCNVLRKRIAASLEISASLNDGTTRRFADEAKLFKFNNPKSRRMLELEIFVSDRDKNHARISIRFDEESSRHIQIIGQASDENIVVLRQELVEIIESTKPSYSWIAIRHSGLGTAPAVLIWAALTASILALISNTLPKFELTKYEFVEMFAACGVWVICMLAFVTFIERSIRWMFPTGVFLIGDEKEDYRKMEGRRSIIGIGVLLALAVSITANYLTRNL